MNFNALRLSSRLFLAFGIVVLLSVLSSGFALLKLQSNQHSLETIVLDNNVRLALNQQMSESIHVVSRVTRTVVLLDDIGEKREQEKKVAAARESYNKAHADLARFPASEAGKALRAEVDSAAAKARELNTRVIALGMDGKKVEATALLMKEAAPNTQLWQDALHKNIALQAKQNMDRFEEAKSDHATARNLLLASALVSALVAAALAWLVVRSIVNELGGEPADVAALARSVADSDLSSNIKVRDGDTNSVVAGMARMQASLSGIVASVRGNADSVATASAQIAQGNADLASRTEEQASALEETAASMEQLSSTVKQNADNARQANQLALNASEVAVNGGDVVMQVVGTMKGINDSSRKIADIISVIDGIAFQTNILALNAAVEAARAGEQGRGFAVVASEVRSLAQRSAEAAKEINSLITDSVERVEQGTALVDRAGVTMQEVVTSIKRVTDIMGEISAASTEQSAGVAQVGEAVSQMDQATQQNSALVEESAAAAESLKVQAEQLVAAVAVFKLGHGVSPDFAATSLAGSGPGAQERRGPNRAKNVARPAFGKPKPAAPKAGAPAQALARTGTDSWETF